ncbi:hypothetical protein MATL_G00035530 [Megalops atlanticus]|uniref:Centrosome and spindle pole-associated protein 1 C-terminal domain-containing protein n=1 Tax=Megalops atlanticus TaxID=7932 RepID=A0A9D3TGK9_MEGAT|nr:hypothetical protein MATL_G00035530 [Megalops atlanticus]
MAKEKVDSDPPYLEIRTKIDNGLDTGKENILPSKWLSAQKEENCGLSLPLGEEYDRKRQKLQQELRLDYRRYMAQKKDVNVGELGLHAQGLSLPIGKRRSAQERLRSERNKEYNQFLRGQGRQGKVVQDATTVLQQAPYRDAERPAASKARAEFRNAQAGSRAPAARERLPSRRDAATLTEAGTPARARRGRRRWEEGPDPRGRRPLVSRLDFDSEQEYSEEELDFVDRRRPRLSRERGHADRPRRRPYHWPEGDMPRLRDRGVIEPDDYPETGHYVQRPRNDNRTQWERRKVDPPVVDEEDYREGKKRTLSEPKPKVEATGPVPPRDRSASVRNKDQAEFATGLMIGAGDEDKAVQMRKERYRQELLEQMAEQQRNKKKEKELELRVAATGAIDPEKQRDREEPDRIKQFGAVTRDYDGKRRDVPYRPGLGLGALGADSGGRGREERPPADRAEDRPPPDRPRVAFQTPMLDYSSALGALVGTGAGAGLAGGGAAPLNEDFHRGLSSTLGEIVAPRITAVPPPPPPTLTDVYRTPYDGAYYYYGARNPLEPNLAYYVPVAGAVQPADFLKQRPGTSQHGGTALQPQATGQTGTAPSGIGVGAFPTERPKPSKESMLSYQEALKQQLQEREERKRREKEEKERYEAKLEAEMRAYNPWGKGGGGAPLRDSKGNLITDLNQMHKVNEEAYLNPDSRGKRAAGSVSRNVPSPRGEDGAPSAHKISGFSYAQTSAFARGSGFTDLPTPQQLHEQDKYRDYLRQQIEEKRQKEAEERERLRLEEEREEKRLAEQRARMQKEYEEEQERKRCKEREQNAQNEEQIRLLKERRKEEERKKREEEEKENAALRQQTERERQAQLQEIPREPSPPIPAVQKRLASRHISRPPSVDSHRSTTTLSEQSILAPPSPPVPARRNQLRAAEEQPGVIGELSALRRQLRSEQRRLDRQLLQTEREEPDTPPTVRRRERPQVDVFDMARLRMQAPVRRNSKTTEPVNLQNIRDFNELKYRDSESREEVRQVYPDPPVDDYSLELQQQALLREQQRRINRMKRREARDYFDLSPQTHHTRNLRGNFADNPQRGSLLESESAFIDSSGDTFPVPPESNLRSNRRAGLASARERRRGQRTDYDNETRTPEPARQPEPAGQREPAGQPDAQSLHSLASFNMEQFRDRNERRMKRLEEMSSQGWTAGEASSDDGDSLLQPAPERRCSVETYATEPWMRPGTSETLKRFMAGRTRRERPSSADSAAWEGPSTYHG